MSIHKVKCRKRILTPEESKNRDEGIERVVGKPSCSECGKEVLWLRRNKPCGDCEGALS